MARKGRRWSPEDGEVVKDEPETQEQETLAAEAATDPKTNGDGEGTVEIAQEAEAETDAERVEVPAIEPGPLSKLQAAIRELLDYDQIGEIRLALSSRTEEIDKHLKKASALGIREDDARRRLRLIEGTEIRYGLLRLFAPEEATSQHDVFFDQQNPNGRPQADETITFRTVDGRDITCLRDELWEHAPDLRALFTAGTLTKAFQKEIKDQDFWHEIEPEEQHGQEQEAAAQLAELSGVNA